MFKKFVFLALLVFGALPVLAAPPTNSVDPEAVIIALRLHPMPQGGGQFGGVVAPTAALNLTTGITTGTSDPNLPNYLFLGSSVVDSYNYSTSFDDVISLIGKNTEVNIGLYVAGLANRVAVIQTLQQGTNGGIEKFWAKPDGGSIGVVAEVEGNAKNLHVLGTGGLLVDPNCTFGSPSLAGCDATAYSPAPNTILSSAPAASNNDVLGIVGSTGAANIDWYLSGTAARLIAQQTNVQGGNGGAISTYAKIDGSSSIAQVQKLAAGMTVFFDGGAVGSSITYSTTACETSYGATTLGTGATTTATGQNCLPANSIIDAVVARVTTTITGACTGWSLGDGTTAARFTTNNTGLTAGTTSVAYSGSAWSTGIASATTGIYQSAAHSITVTCAGGNPSAGAIRIIVYSHTSAGPTS